MMTVTASPTQFQSVGTIISAVQCVAESNDAEAFDGTEPWRTASRALSNIHNENAAVGLSVVF